MARATKRTPARVKAILDAIRLGQPLVRAAAAGGIDYSSFQNWMHDIPSFSQDVAVATAEGELYVLGCLRRAADDGSVTAMLGWLERRFPDEWSRGERLKQEVSGSVDVHHVIRNVQAVLDAVLPQDAEVRQRVAEGLMELDASEQVD